MNVTNGAFLPNLPLKGSLITKKGHDVLDVLMRKSSSFI